MHIFLRIEEEQKNSRSKMLFLSFIYAGIFAATILSEFLLMKYSSHDYAVPLFFSILIGILFCLFSVYFFSIPFRRASAYSHLVQSFKNGEKKEMVLRISSNECGPEFYQGFPCFGLIATDEQSLKKDKVYLICFENPKGLEVGQVYKVKCSGKFVLEAKQ